MPLIPLTIGQIRTSMHSGFSLAAAQFTYSIPVPGSIWETTPGNYTTDTTPGLDYQPFDAAYSVLDATQTASFELALAAWDSLIAADFTEVADNGAGHGEVRIAFTSVDMGGSTAGYAFQGSNQVPTSIVGDIWLNSNSTGSDYASGGDDFATLLHEIGHVLGLQHSFDDLDDPGDVPLPDPYDDTRYTVLSYTVPLALVFFDAGGGSIGIEERLVNPLTPGVVDIAAVQDLYGADTGTAGGDTTYVVGQTDLTFQSIWDTGGTDTIDLSAVTRDSVVDLREGSYSSIGLWTEAEQITFYATQFGLAEGDVAAFFAGDDYYEWEDNLGIAFGVTIENLIAGSGDDTITGNDAANFLTLDLGGNDTVDGGGGDDSFAFGASFTSADTVIGGAGTNDQIGLEGNYTGGNALTLGAASVTGVEVLAVLPGFDYSITTVDGNIASGASMTFFGGNLGAGDNFTFNAAAELDGECVVYCGLGTDLVTTGAGDDGVYFGPGKFNPAVDRVNGTSGTNDQFALDGDYTLTLDGIALVNIDVVALLPGEAGDLSDYNLTLADSLIGAGQTMTFWGSSLLTSLTLSGVGETNGVIRVYGGTLADTLTGGAGADWFWGGTGGDSMTGGTGADTFNYTAVGESSGAAFDRLFGFDDNADDIDLPFAVGSFAAAQAGALNSATMSATLAAAFAGLTANQAGVYTATGGDMVGRVFLLVDGGGGGGYQAASDYLIEMVAAVSPIDQLGMFV